MSLVRLLEMGRSLKVIRETQSRYRMQRQNLLPKFGMAGSAAWYPPVAATEATERATSGLRLRNLTDALEGPIGGKQTETIWAKLSRAFLICFDRTGGFFGKILRPLSTWAAKSSADRFVLRHRTAPSVVSPPKTATTPIQTELSLDKVKVVRNDLSDADLEVVPMVTVCGSLEKSPPAQVAVLGGRTNGLWSRLTAWLFQVPLGYQNETGFHFGVKPAEKEAGWPPIW